MKHWNESATLRGAWRRVFSRSPICKEVLEAGKRYVPKFNQDGARAKKDSVEYHCQVCNTWVKASIGGKKNIQVDHIKPVIAVDNVTGEVQDWNLYKKDLFCVKENLQRICKSCHDSKTYKERMERNTIKYNFELDIISKGSDAKTMKKLLTKYTTKTRPTVIRERALQMKQRLK
jgi:5-methylcytosine-specific restriction endonuclease McrA